MEEKEKIKAKLETSYAELEYFTQDKHNIRYLWDRWDGYRTLHPHSLSIFKKIRTFVKEDSVYIRTRICDLETIESTIIDFDTEIPKNKFKLEMSTDIIKENLDWILSYYREELLKYGLPNNCEVSHDCVHKDETRDNNCKVYDDIRECINNKVNY